MTGLSLLYLGKNMTTSSDSNNIAYHSNQQDLKAIAVSSINLFPSFVNNDITAVY